MRHLISAFVAFVIIAGSCNHQSRSTLTHNRHVTLDIIAVCVDGSGAFGHAAAIGPTIAVTAKHIVGACGSVPGKLYVGGAEAVVVSLGNGDSAVVRILTGEFQYYAPIGKAPSIGDAVCFTRGCGRVLDSSGDMVLIEVEAIPGDSGSPVYDSNGYIVGLVSARTPNGYMVATTVDDYRIAPKPPTVDGESL